jgi:hypothetical protein
MKFLTMKSLSSAALVLTLCSTQLSFADYTSSKNLRNGDIIFVHSHSKQAAAIQETTESEWTHVGTVFKFPNLSDQTKIVDNDQDGYWFVYEASATLRFTTLHKFVGGDGPRVIRRLRENINFETAKHLFQTALDIKRELDVAKKNTPNNYYDGLFLDPRRYCSGLVWLLFKKAKIMKNDLAEPTLIGDLKGIKNPSEMGPVTKKIIAERLDLSDSSAADKKNAKLTLDQWKTKTTITPISILKNEVDLVPVADDLVVVKSKN